MRARRERSDDRSDLDGLPQRRSACEPCREKPVQDVAGTGRIDRPDRRRRHGEPSFRFDDDGVTATFANESPFEPLEDGLECSVLVLVRREIVDRVASEELFDVLRGSGVEDDSRAIPSGSRSESNSTTGSVGISFWRRRYSDARTVSWRS